MSQFVRYFLFIAIALIAGTQQLKARAGPIDDVEAGKIEQVIATQLLAFANDDAEQAFDTATPAVQEAVGTSSRFLAMVRTAYPMVYRPTAATFQKPESGGDGGVLQMLDVRDRQDRSWIAIFALERQGDDTWRISGCVVIQNTWKAA